MGIVHTLTIPPKQETHRHRAIEYTLTYIPATKQWLWEFYVVTRTRYHGESESYLLAGRAAKQHINYLHGITT